MVFSVFDPIKENPHEVVRLQEETGNMNSGLSPDGKIHAWREPHPIAVTFGPANSRAGLKKLEHFFFRGLDGGFERAVWHEQPDRLAVQLAVRGSGRQCA